MRYRINVYFETDDEKDAQKFLEEVADEMYNSDSMEVSVVSLSIDEEDSEDGEDSPE